MVTDICFDLLEFIFLNRKKKNPGIENEDICNLRMLCFEPPYSVIILYYIIVTPIESLSSTYILALNLWFLLWFAL